jgi:hypothetical protein
MPDLVIMYLAATMDGQTAAILQVLVPGIVD